MNKRSALTTAQRLASEATLDAIEAAVHLDLDVDAQCELPAGLRDPIAVMERVRRLIEEDTRSPLNFSPDSLETEADLEEYWAVARNGSPIPDEVLRQMHEERRRAEAANSGGD